MSLRRQGINGDKKGHGGRIDTPGRKGTYAFRKGNKNDSGVNASREIEDFWFLYFEISCAHIW